MRATSVEVARILIVTLMAVATLSWSAAAAAENPQDEAFNELLKKARTDESLRETVRMEVEGLVDRETHQLTVYGRGIGIWNKEGQFTLTSKNVVAAIDLLIDAKFSDMPERFAFDEETEHEEKPVQLIRVVTVTVGNLSKTVVQDNKGPKSEPFAKLAADLVSMCRKPAENLVTASSLTDGLEKVATGTLAPETLTVMVNAPELRSLKSQEGQGWQLSIRNAHLELTSVTIAHGVQKVSERALDQVEAKKLVKTLLDAKVADLPTSINTSGYTQLTVAVLNQKVRTLARTFAGEPGKDAMEAAASFGSAREVLHTMYKEGVKARSAD